MATCVPCGEEFPTAAALIDHVQTHGGRADHRYPEEN